MLQVRITDFLSNQLQKRSWEGQKVINTLRAAGVKCWDLLELHQSEDSLKSLAYCLEVCQDTPLVLCGGGDGTNAWALSTIDRAKAFADFDYHFATIPLGSGNDLSNALGWGNRYPGSKKVAGYCTKIAKTKSFTKLDRWDIKATRNGEEVPGLTTEMVNFVNLGYGAKIAARFHEAREKAPGVWNSPKKNWLKYAALSTKYMFCNNRVLNNELEMYADGKRVTLPKGTRDIVISNINSMAQGAFYWGEGKSREGELQDFTPPQMGDGKLEIMTSDSMGKNVKMAFGGHYHRLAQASTVKILVKRTQAIGWDGEAFFYECSGESPLELVFSCKGKVVCPVGSNKPRGVTTCSATAKSPVENDIVAGEVRPRVEVEL